jgi:hypothetical protein
MPNSQHDLFADLQTEHREVAPRGFEPPPPDFIARIRSELAATLENVRTAATLPWSDLTRATLAELRFHSIAGWLPDDEAAALRAAFETEMARLYDSGDHASS